MFYELVIDIGRKNNSHEFGQKNIEEASNSFIKEINRAKLLKRVCTVSNYTEHLLILASGITGCGSISAFAS